MRRCRCRRHGGSVTKAQPAERPHRAARGSAARGSGMVRCYRVRDSGSAAGATEVDSDRRSRTGHLPSASRAKRRDPRHRPVRAEPRRTAHDYSLPRRGSKELRIIP